MASYYVYDHDPSMTRREAERIVQDVVRHNPYIRGEPSIAYARGRSRHTLRGYRQEVYVMPAEANRMDRDHHQIDHRAAQSSSGKVQVFVTHSGTPRIYDTTYKLRRNSKTSIISQPDVHAYSYGDNGLTDRQQRSFARRTRGRCHKK